MISPSGKIQGRWEIDKNHRGFESAWKEFVERWCKFREDWDEYLSALEEMRAVLEVQKSNGNWNHDPYMHGMYNGMELMMALAERRAPVYKEAPEQWGKDNPDPGILEGRT